MWKANCNFILILQFNFFSILFNANVLRQVAGLPTNINFLLKLANHRAFQNGDVETHFIEHFKDDLFVDPSNSLLVDKVLGAARFSATLAAACLIEKENSLFRENLRGKLKVPFFKCMPFRKGPYNIYISLFRWRQHNLHMVFFSPFQSPSLC